MLVNAALYHRTHDDHPTFSAGRTIPPPATEDLARIQLPSYRRLITF